MLCNSNSNRAKKACVVAVIASGIARVGAEASMTGFQTRRLKAACRGEEVCLNQVCDPTSFQYNVGAGEGEEFPYEVTHSVRGGQVEFKVCPNSSAKESCASKSGGCSGLVSFKLRMRNDALSMGRDLISDPAGRMWASCSSHGPGHEWMDAELGSLAGSPSTSKCETFTVQTAGTKKPSLSDICQQKVKIMENSGWTVVDTSSKPNSCFVTLVTANGRVGYAVVGGDTPSPPPPAPKEKPSSPPPPADDKEDVVTASSVETSDADEEDPTTSTVVTSSVATPSGYGARAGISSYGARASVSSYGARAGISSYGPPAARRRVLRGGRRMF